jgi:hypothetical protein
MKTTCLLLILTFPALAWADVVLDWNDVALAAIQRNSTPPPVAARALAMMHIAIYDAVNSIEPTHQAFRINYAESPSTSREAAAAHAAYRVLLQNFPLERTRLEGALTNSLARIPEGAEKSAGIRLGEAVAAQVVAWRENDGSKSSVLHTPGTQPGQWRPTPPDFKPALLPQWATVKPFGIANASQFRPAFPPMLASEEYARNVEEVREFGSRNSTKRTWDQTQIAFFWADGAGTVTPPGHWNRIAQTVARSAGLSVHENARLFALLNAALADAAIVCWDMKFSCNLWRPITAIQEADTDGNDRTTRDPNWRPLLDTPPFPSCTSGHSTFSGAAAQLLASFFGRDDVQFTDNSGTQGASRTYNSFSQAAEEAGRSRIYGGIHFEFDNQGGLRSGREVGRYVFDHYLQPVSASGSQRVASRTVYRPPADDGWVGLSAAGNQTDTRTSAEHSVVTKNSSSSPIATTSNYPKAATTSNSTTTSAGTPTVTEYAPANVVYCVPTFADYQPVTEVVQPVVTYYYPVSW